MKIYYEAVEYIDGKGILIENPNAKIEKVRWNRFTNYNDAKRRLEKAIEDRKHQYFYFRNNEGKIVDKISFYERNKLTYKVFKIVEQEEMLYETNNDDIELKVADKSLQEETPL